MRDKAGRGCCGTYWLFGLQDMHEQMMSRLLDVVTDPA